MTFEALLGASDGIGMNMGPDHKTGISTPMAGATGTGPATSTGAAAGTVMNTPAEGAQFKMEAARLRETARAYTERQVTQGEGQLLQAFLDERITLQSYLRPIDDENNVVIIGDAQTKAIFDFAVQVLRDRTVAGRFGRPPASQQTWPLGGVLDENGSLLIQEIGESLFLRKLVLGIPAQASGKNLTRPLLPSAPQPSCSSRFIPNQGYKTCCAMTRRDFVKPAFSLRKQRFVKTHALSLLGTTRLPASQR
ncbi:MAG: hypothetical protein ACXWTP_13950, partial [Methylosarcina sp.]